MKSYFEANGVFIFTSLSCRPNNKTLLWFLFPFLRCHLSGADRKWFLMVQVQSACCRSVGVFFFVCFLLISLSLRSGLLLLTGWWRPWWEEATAEGAPLARVPAFLLKHRPSGLVHLRLRHGQPPGADPGASAAGQGAQPGEAAGGAEAADAAAEEMGRLRKGDAEQEAKGWQESSQCQQPPAGMQEARVIRRQRGAAGGVGQERSRGR